MNRFKFISGIIALLMVLIFNACERQADVVSPAADENENAAIAENADQELDFLLEDADFDADALPLEKYGHRGALFTMTNSASGNEVLFFDRSSDGTLSEQGAWSTEGLGTGGGLGNQGGLILSKGRGFLLACNAGSNDISLFKVKRNGLELLDRVPSGGERPVSLALRGRLLYVLNAGGDGNISAFIIKRHGTLEAIDGSTRPLSGSGSAPAQISFNNQGRVLVVTEKATNQILTYTVNYHGLADGPAVHASSGATPFGFAFNRAGYLIVSEAFGGAPNASAVSSYDVSRNGNVSIVCPSIATNQTAACWIAITGNGKYAYTTNTGSGNISGYRVKGDGSLRLLDSDGIAGVTGPGSAPIDMALSRNSDYLYSLNSGTGNISIFRIKSNGDLKHIEETASLPAGTNGLAAF